MKKYAVAGMKKIAQRSLKARRRVAKSVNLVIGIPKNSPTMAGKGFRDGAINVRRGRPK